jgi:hypothetical protein
MTVGVDSACGQTNQPVSVDPRIVHSTRLRSVIGVYAQRVIVDAVERVEHPDEFVLSAGARAPSSSTTPSPENQVSISSMRRAWMARSTSVTLSPGLFHATRVRPMAARV